MLYKKIDQKLINFFLLFLIYIFTYYALTFTQYNSFLFIIAILFSFFSFIILRDLLSKNQISLTNILFVVFYIVGFVLSFSNINLNQSDYVGVGWNKIGDFKFTNINIFFMLFLSNIFLFASYLGITTGKKLTYFFSKLRISQKYLKKLNFNLIVVFFTFITILLIFFMENLGIGKHGLKDEVDLFGPLNGLLRYVKGGIFFATCFYLYDIMRLNSKSISNYVKLYFLIYFIIFFLVNSLIGLSRSGIIFWTLPFLLPYFINLKVRFFILNVIIFLFIIIIFMNVTTEYRSIFDENLQMQSKLNYFEKYKKIISLINFSVIDIKNFFNFLIIRIEGIKEIMLVFQSNTSKEDFLTYYFSVHDKLDYFSNKIWAFQLSDSHAWGRTLGIFGMSYLAKSAIVLFFISFISFMILKLLEEYFLAKKYYSLSIYITVTLFVIIWNNQTFEDFSRRILIIFSLIFVIKIINILIYDQKKIIISK